MWNVVEMWFLLLPLLPPGSAPSPCTPHFLLLPLFLPFFSFPLRTPKAFLSFPLPLSTLLALPHLPFHSIPPTHTTPLLSSLSTLLKVYSMSIDFMSEEVIHNEVEEPDSKYNYASPKNSDTSVYEIIYSFLKQGNSSIIKLATNVAKKATPTRLTRKSSEVFDSLFEDEGKQEKKRCENKSGPLLSGLAYCVSSCSMILLNKAVLSGYNFTAGISLMLYQNLVCVFIIIVLQLCRVVSTEKMTWKLIRVWMPVNITFVGMLCTGMYSLKYINVAMVTILKNMTNILTAIGEIYLFRKMQSQKVWAALFLMVVSAICGGITDLSFNAVGYIWQILNCFLTAAYSLILRRVMDTAKQSTESGSLNEVSMVLLNNSLSIPFAIVLVLLLDEWEYVYNAEVITRPMFWFIATISGVLGLAISFTSVWFLHQTGPTTYSLVGSLNKIPISIAGILLFKVPVSIPNLFSILFGLFAGIFFAKAKMS